MESRFEVQNKDMNWMVGKSIARLGVNSAKWKSIPHFEFKNTHSAPTHSHTQRRESLDILIYPIKVFFFFYQPSNKPEEQLDLWVKTLWFTSSNKGTIKDNTKLPYGFEFKAHCKVVKIHYIDWLGCICRWLCRGLLIWAMCWIQKSTASVDFPFQRGAKHLHWKQEREEKCLYEERTMVPAHE